MTIVQSGDAINLPVAAEAIVKGKIYKDNASNQLTVITADGDTALAIADQSSVDAEQTAVTKAAGDLWGFHLLGCGKIVQVYSKASQTYALGARVVCSDDVDGACAATADSATDTVIGTYAGQGETTSSSDGDLVPVLLNHPPEVADS